MPRVLLLLPTTTYRTKAFVDAALKLGVDVTAAAERPSTLERENPAGLLTLDFFDPERAARQARDFDRDFPLSAVIPVDEDTAVAAAWIARALRLEHNSVSSVQIAKNKYLMRECLKSNNLRVPRYWHFTLDEDIQALSRRVQYPCVVKPVFLSTSRGVMRVDDESQFVSAIGRLEAILIKKDVARRGLAASRQVLVEEFIPGREVALEGLVSDSELQLLALFDKPDPLDGPFFEETIYVTPSRLPAGIQEEIQATTRAAIRAMGLARGPIHAELRINEQGVWVIEVAARAIGGLCSRALRFGQSLSLEELIIRHALGQDVARIERESQAAAVMMIPIPRGGVLKEVRGIDEARRVEDVEDVVITAHVTQEILPPPEGGSYLGFIFSRAETPDRAERAVREAHSSLEFIIQGTEQGSGGRER
jgi:biotin carboxylase